MNYGAGGYRAGSQLDYVKLESLALRARYFLAPAVAVDHAFPAYGVFDDFDKLTILHQGERYACDTGVSEELPSPVAGRTILSPDGVVAIELSTVSYLSLVHHRGSGRLTFCHELIHAIQHMDVLVKLLRIPHQQAALNRGAFHTVYEDTEFQANAGASALLMPARGLDRFFWKRRGRVSAGDVAAHFNVPLHDARVRLAVFEAFRRRLLEAEGGREAP